MIEGKMSDKIIVLTGANRGIGLGLVREFLDAGHKVFSTYRQEGTQNVLEALSATVGGRLHLVRMDVTDDDSVAAAAQRVSDEVERVDLLVNNAGVFPGESGTSLPELDFQDMRTAFEVNTIGPLRVTQAFLLLLKNAATPSVANVSSGAGSLSQAIDNPHYAYGMSKAALNRVTIGMTKDPALQGIIITAFTPGWVKTDMGGENADLSLEESTGPLARAMLNLKPGHNGEFLDRNGEVSPFKW